MAKVDGEAEDPAPGAPSSRLVMRSPSLPSRRSGAGTTARMFFGDVLGTALPFLIGWFATAPSRGRSARTRG